MENKQFAPQDRADPTPQDDFAGWTPEFTVWVVRRGSRLPPMSVDSIFADEESAQKRARVLGNDWRVEKYSHFQPPVAAPARAHQEECQHEFVEFTVCRHCGRTEAAITGCHHCNETAPGKRCWWCLTPFQLGDPHPAAAEPEDVKLAEDYCIVCGELLSKHYSPCRGVGDAAGVLRLLERLVNDGKRAAAIRVLDRHLRERPNDGRKLVQSDPHPTAAPDAGAPQEGAGPKTNDDEMLYFLAAYYQAPDRATLLRCWPERTLDEIDLLRAWETRQPKLAPAAHQERTDVEKLKAEITRMATARYGVRHLLRCQADRDAFDKYEGDLRRLIGLAPARAAHQERTEPPKGQDDQMDDIDYLDIVKNPPVGGAFHWRDGYLFQRTKLGAVLVTLPNNSQKVIPPNEWASIVAHVSRLGETGETWRQALDFHGAA